MNFTDEELSRYSRQLLLRELGGTGQQQLKSAKVLIVGAGGLGSPASLYLAAAGIGQLMMIDPDLVENSNLHRQVIYQSSDLGKSKAVTSGERLKALNPNVDVKCLAEDLTTENAPRVVEEADVVLDGTDNFQTRLLVNAECVRQRKPLVSGAVGRWTGHIGVFRGQPCYQCLVRKIPAEAETCSTVGVVGAVVGVIGSLMALEAIKIITQFSDASFGQLGIFDGLRSQSTKLTIAADPKCPICSSANCD